MAASLRIVAAVNTSTTTFMSSRYQMNCLLPRRSGFGTNIVQRVMAPPDVEAILLTGLERVGLGATQEPPTLGGDFVGPIGACPFTGSPQPI